MNDRIRHLWKSGFLILVALIFQACSSEGGSGNPDPKPSQDEGGPSAEKDTEAASCGYAFKDETNPIERERFWKTLNGVWISRPAVFEQAKDPYGVMRYGRLGFEVSQPRARYGFVGIYFLTPHENNYINRRQASLSLAEARLSQALPSGPWRGYRFIESYISNSSSCRTILVNLQGEILSVRAESSTMGGGRRDQQEFLDSVLGVHEYIRAQY